MKVSFYWWWHRLKSQNIKTAQAIRALPTKRRIILSGTPIQALTRPFLCSFSHGGHALKE
ncbi:hypothetical protein BC936DRAFT_142393 [Jimgerdemannia flammicorona]|uniref:SNF2 N-terminal domain-containing protein n=1 Tax=Jimgerdemannia flammicorona TaxID=994334 RepID=A0A433DF54_9FUNG|nr:hypothetical protein BC936DRAFT_142393 [Jimgerdemannia flammicorona]